MSVLGELDWRPVLVSLHVASAATVLSVALGSVLGWIFAHRDFPGRRAVESAVLLPLVLPPTVLGYYLLVLIGANGPIGRAWMAAFGEPLVFTRNAAIAAACVATVPIVARQLSAAFAAIDEEATEAARLAGAGAWSLFWHIHLPQIRGPLGAAATIAFARALGDFGMTLMVAGSIPGRTQTASLAIYDLISAGRAREATVLVALVSVVAIGALWAVAGTMPRSIRRRG